MRTLSKGEFQLNLKELVDVLPNRYGYAKKVLLKLEGRLQEECTEQTVYNVVKGAVFKREIVDALIEVVEEYLAEVRKINQKISSIMDQNHVAQGADSH